MESEGWRVVAIRVSVLSRRYRGMKRHLVCNLLSNGQEKFLQIKFI